MNRSMRQILDEYRMKLHRSRRNGLMPKTIQQRRENVVRWRRILTREAARARATAGDQLAARRLTWIAMVEERRATARAIDAIVKRAEVLIPAIEAALQRGRTLRGRRYTAKGRRYMESRLRTLREERACALAQTAALQAAALVRYRDYVRSATVGWNARAELRAAAGELIDSIEHDIDALCASGFCERARRLEDLLGNEPAAPGRRLIDVDRILRAAFQRARSVRETLERDKDHLARAIRHLGVRRKAPEQRTGEDWLRRQLDGLARPPAGSSGP